MKTQNKKLISLNQSVTVTIDKFFMKQLSIIFLQTVVIIIGIGTLVIMLWEPHIEGRNAHASFFDIYFEDPFLVYAYVASIPFFVTLYKAFKVLGHIGKNRAFSKEAVKNLRTIRYCAICTIGFVAGGEIFIMLNHGNDDPAGGIFMGILLAFCSVVIATASAVFERILQNGIDLKSENKQQ